MGTSTGYGLPTSGNWPAVKAEVTRFGKGGELTSERIGKLMRNYTVAHGGAAAASAQMGSSVRAAARLGGLLSKVGEAGLSEGLRDSGLAALVGQSVWEVLSGLADYLAGPGSVVEDDIARWAWYDLCDEYFGTSLDYDALANRFSEIVRLEGLGGILIRYFGLCIFRRFRLHFSERLLKVCGSRPALSQQLRSVKDYIFARLTSFVGSRNPTGVDWRGAEGNQVSQRLLTDAWATFGGH